MPEELAVITNPSTALSRRVRYWREMHGPVPQGKVVDVTCGDRLCINRAHMFLRDKIVSHKYTAMRDRLIEMDYNEWFDVPNPPPINEIGKFRCGLNSICGTIKFSIRSWPSGRVQIIKTGKCGIWGEDDFSTADQWTVRTRIAPWKRKAVFFLGFMRNYGTDIIQRVLTCKIPACPMPVLRGAGDYCHHHNHFFDYNESMTWNGLDRGKLFNPRFPAHSQAYELAAEFLRSTDTLERSLIYEPSNRGIHRHQDNRHKNAGTENLEVLKHVSIAPRRMGHRLGHGSSSSSKTTAGRARAASRIKGSRHSTKQKRWTRETIEALERQADELLGLDSPAVVTLAEIMRAEQESLLGGAL